MRIWLDPARLQARNLVPQDVIDAVQQQSQQVAAGQIGMPPAAADQNLQYTIDAPGRLSDADQFADIIVKTVAGESGQITRLRDVARVELGAQSYNQFFKLDGKPAAGIAIFQLPEANALDVATRVEATVECLAAAFPPGLVHDIPFDTTTRVRASIDEVYRTLFIAAVLVLILIGEFARNLRRNHRKEILDAAVEVARLRFRPILMTSFAFILGVLPLVFATAAGANARKSIGVAGVRGMLAATCIAVLFVPAFFVVLQRFSGGRRTDAGLAKRTRQSLPIRVVDRSLPGTVPPKATFNALAMFDSRRHGGHVFTGLAQCCTQGFPEPGG